MTTDSKNQSRIWLPLHLFIQFNDIYVEVHVSTKYSELKWRNVYVKSIGGVTILSDCTLGHDTLVQINIPYQSVVYIHISASLKNL